MASLLNNPENVLFFDIETSGIEKDFSHLSDREKDLFTKRFKKRSSNGVYWGGTTPEEAFVNKSPIIPIFGKIVCISLGYIKNGEIKTKSFTGEECDILKNSSVHFNNANNLQWSLCGFNIKNFDLPWINHKFIKYDIKMPYFISLIGKKPWELNIFDLFEYVTSNTDYPSFDEMCYEWNITSPKTEMSGDKVHEYFWSGRINEISKYCENDVKACVEMYIKIYESQI